MYFRAIASDGEFPGSSIDFSKRGFEMDGWNIYKNWAIWDAEGKRLPITRQSVFTCGRFHRLENIIQEDSMYAGCPYAVLK